MITVLNPAPFQRLVRRLDAAGVANIRPATTDRIEQVVFEAAAIELVRGDGRKDRRPQLESPGQVAVVRARKEIPEAELGKLRAAQVRLELKALAEIVRADLDARLADLEGGFRHRMRPLLDDQHAQVRRLQMQLPRKTPAGEAAAENRHVEDVRLSHAATF